MVKQRSFTIMELLVAITITVVAVNLLSSLYVRATSLAIEQTQVQSLTRRGMMAMDSIQNELRNLIIPIPSQWSGNISSNIPYPIFIGQIRGPNGASPYPGMIYHRQKTVFDTGSSSTDFGIEEVALFLAPAEGGFSEDPYLQLYTITNSTYNAGTEVFSNSLFDSGRIDGEPNDIGQTQFDSKQIIVERVIGMTIDAHFLFVDPGNNDKFPENIEDLDPPELLIEESNTIEALQFIVTLAPMSISLGFNCPDLDTVDDVGESITGPYITSYPLEKGLYHHNQGFFANFETGDVFRYTRSGDAYLKIENYLDDACSSSGKGLGTGLTFSRYFNLR
jgi:type II secretory pathway pseudopilin PulG